MCEHSHHITHHKPKEENTKKKFLGRVLGPDGILTTSHIITSHHIRHHKPKRQKSTSFLVKTSFKSIAEHRKVRELPRKMNIEEVEEPKKYENLQTKPVLDPFKSTADHLKVRELARKTNIEEVEEPETTKIYRQNPLTPAAATRKLREFTDETNMQARKHENSDEFCAPPVRHLDLATRPFTITVRTPSVKHTVSFPHLHNPSLVQDGVVVSGCVRGCLLDGREVLIPTQTSCISIREIPVYILALFESPQVIS